MNSRLKGRTTQPGTETIWFNHHRQLWDPTRGASASSTSPRRWRVSPKGGREDQSCPHTRAEPARPRMGQHGPQGGGMSMREVLSIRRSYDPPRPSRALRVPPPRDASRPLPFRAGRAFTSTVGIGAASCSGVRFPNSSASTSMLLTAKEEANRRPHAPASAGSRSSRRERGAWPKRSPPRRWMEGATERFRPAPRPEPEVEPGCG